MQLRRSFITLDQERSHTTFVDHGISKDRRAVRLRWISRHLRVGRYSPDRSGQGAFFRQSSQRLGDARLLLSGGDSRHVGSPEGHPNENAGNARKKVPGAKFGVGGDDGRRNVGPSAVSNENQAPHFAFGDRRTHSSTNFTFWRYRHLFILMGWFAFRKGIRCLA